MSPRRRRFPGFRAFCTPAEFPPATHTHAIHSPARAPAPGDHEGGRMRVTRVGHVRLAFAIGVALVLGAPATLPAIAAPTTPTPAPQSFKVTISPEYTTGGQPTTFQVTVVN